MKNIKVQLLHYTPKEVLIEAMSMPYKTDNFRNISTEEAVEKIKAICIDKKHSSVLEHITFNFKIEGISRLCLQELVRHRMANYTVESTRYTLPSWEEADKLFDALGSRFINLNKDKRNEVIKILQKYFVIPNEIQINQIDIMYNQFKELLRSNYTTDKKDIIKYFLPESWRTNLVMSINIRSLRNLLYFRLDKYAHFEIRHLAYLIYQQIPKEYKILFGDLFEKRYKILVKDLIER